MLKARNILLYFVYKYKSDFNLIIQALKNKEEVKEEEVEKVVNSTKTKFITLLDTEYPENLKKTNQPPLLLFYDGDITLLKKETQHKLSIVGSRESSDYGINSTKEIVSSLEDDYIVISGLAKGVDSASHEAALDNNLKTIAVLGDGLNKVYPPENKELLKRIIDNGGLVLSEYHDNVEPQKEYFLARNRIIAGLCNFLLVSEAYKRSGTQRTVTYALNYGKEVGCIPYQIGKGSFCNQLIKEGAYLIESGSDISRILEKN